MVLQKDKQIYMPLARLIKKKREDPKKQNKNKQKRLLQATLCQSNGQPGRNGQILRKV